MKRVGFFVSIALMAPMNLVWASPAADASTQPRLEHIAVWVESVDKTAKFLADCLGWRRHPLEFGVDDTDKTFGGMKLAFVDANGLWLELVEPTTPGPGLEFLKQKGNGALVELDFFVDDFDKTVAAVKAKNIQPMGMDGKPMVNGGLLSEWAIKEGRRVRGNERLMYFPMEVSHGTSVEIGWEYPSGVVLLRDATWSDQQRTPRSGPRVNHTVVLAADLAKTTKFYTYTLNLKQHSTQSGIRSDWMGVGDKAHVWIDGNERGTRIQVVAPPATAAGKALLANTKYGDGAIMELGVTVKDIDAFYDQMKTKGITMTAGDGKALPAGTKAIQMDGSGDRYSYFPVGKSEGMRIMVFQAAAQK